VSTNPNPRVPWKPHFVAVYAYLCTKGANRVAVLHAAFDPLDGALANHVSTRAGDGRRPGEPEGFCKVVCLRPEDGDDGDDGEGEGDGGGSGSDEGRDGWRVVGLHFVGPHAGEVVQGFSVALSLGLTLGALQASVGLHPTGAEELLRLRAFKRTGKVAQGAVAKGPAAAPLPPPLPPVSGC